jgi:hypothetical protein
VPGIIDRPVPAKLAGMFSDHFPVLDHPDQVSPGPDRRRLSSHLALHAVLVAVIGDPARSVSPGIPSR